MIPPVSSQNSLSASQEQFLNNEYKALREEVLQTLKEAREVERNVVAAVAVVLVWIATYTAGAKSTQNVMIRNDMKFAWWIPVALVVLGIARSSAILKVFNNLSVYIKQVERTFLDGAAVAGWEHFSEPRKGFISTTGFALWIGLLLGTVFLAVWPPM